MIGRASYNPMNGRLTATPIVSFSYDDAKTQKGGSNHWSSTENNRNNGRNVNFNNGNTNNNNKYNSNVVRPVAAFQDCVPDYFIQSVWDAYYDCLKGKMRSEGAVEYMVIADDDIPALAYELWTGIYKPGTSTCFLVSYPKWREVFAAGFRDRIVHHWVCLRLNPLFEHRFIHQGNVSFNCRKGFGTDMAVLHLAEGMRKVSGNYRKPAWIFKGDLVGFFMSIDKDLLWYLLSRFMARWKFRSEKFGWQPYQIYDMPDMYWDILMRTTKVIVMHHPERDCILNSAAHLWEEHMEPNKSLFTSPTGEPIGNLTTQLFANFLMSFFVMLVQWLYRHQNYCMAQFVDDFAIACDDLRFLVDSIPKLEQFLARLKLKLHKDKRYLQPVSHGVLFVGTYIKPGRKYLSSRTLSRMKEHCKGFAKMLEGEYDTIQLLRIEQTLNSYLGFCLRRRTYGYRKEWIDEMGEGFWKRFYVKGHYESVHLKDKYKPIFNSYEYLFNETSQSGDYQAA